MIKPIYGSDSPKNSIMNRIAPQQINKSASIFLFSWRTPSTNHRTVKNPNHRSMEALVAAIHGGE